MKDQKSMKVFEGKIKILIPIGCRSDEGLSAPLIRRLKEAEWCWCRVKYLNPSDFHESYINIEHYVRLWKPDLIIITGDRIEMAGAAAAAFHNNIPIAHFYAGIITNGATHDAMNRHCITLYSDIAFCESRKAVWTVRDLWLTSGKIDKYQFYENLKSLETYGIYETGISHLDDIELDLSLVPNEPYDLLLFNPITTSVKQNKEDLIQIYTFLKHSPRRWILIGPNPDMNIEFKDFPLTYNNLPRPQFLGLLSRCARFISNSSSVYYEAPQWLRPEQIIHVGERNKDRSTPKKLETGASDKIVDILKEYFEVDI